MKKHGDVRAYKDRATQSVTFYAMYSNRFNHWETSESGPMKKTICYSHEEFQKLFIPTSEAVYEADLWEEAAKYNDGN